MDAFIGQYALNFVRLDSADLADVEDDGGYVVNLFGQFKDATATIRLINAGNPLLTYSCYGAQSGQGYTPRPRNAGWLPFASAVVPPGAYEIEVVQGVDSFNSADAVVPFLLTVHVRNWRSRTLALRKAFPPWYRTGPRTLDGVELLP
jgi:hypothetical protein